MNSVDANVFTAHFKQFLKTHSLSEQDQLLIEYVVHFVEKGVNPVSSLTQQSIDRFYELTSVNLNKTNIEGLVISESQKLFDETTEPVQLTFDQIILAISSTFNAQETTACVHYSMSVNTSSDYAYANIVDQPTCSHPNPPHSSTCPYSVHQVKCPYFTPDIKEETFVIENVSYRIVYQRTVQAMMNIHIYDDVNLVAKLTYYIDKYRENSSQQIRDEISSIITEHHSNSYMSDTSSLSSKFLQNEEEKSNSSSYISSLVS